MSMIFVKYLVVFQTCWKADKNCNAEKIAGLVLPFLSDSIIQQVCNTTAILVIVLAVFDYLLPQTVRTFHGFLIAYFLYFIPHPLTDQCHFLFVKKRVRLP